MSNDIRHILDRLATVEGRLTPAQQKVPQLPALFKPKHIRALGSRTDPAHPMDGYMVGDSVQPRGNALEEAMAEIEEDMVSRVKKDLTQYLDHLEKKGRVNNELKNKARDAIERGEVEEETDSDDAISNSSSAGAEPTLLGLGALAKIGNSPNPLIKGITRVAGPAFNAYSAINRSNAGDYTGAAIDAVGMHPMLSYPAMGINAVRDKYYTGTVFPSDLELGNAHQTSVLIGNKRPPSQLAADELSKKMGVNPNTLLPMKENAPVRTYTMENGKTLECYGDEQNGFEIRHAGRSLPTRFPNLEHADIAVRLFQNRQPAEPDQDYLEEK